MSQAYEKMEQEMLITLVRLNIMKHKLQAAVCAARLADERSEELERANEYLRGVLGNRGP